MTIEEKAKAYDEVLGRAKSLVDFCSDNELKTLKFVFPELRESEDERIRKEILDYIDKATGCKRWVAWLEKQEDKDSQVKLPTFDDIFALQCCMETVKQVQEDKDLYEKLNDLHGRVYDAYHLEKQGEQKPADKIEPKFKVGDWCIDNEDGTIFQIVKVLDNTYKYRTDEGKEYSCTHYSLELDARVWNMSDAKEGDVLVDSLGNVCIYQEPSTKLMYHSHCYGNHKFFIPIVGSHEIVGSYPATKEQRDQLEKAMADAGYVFDFEKKELKEIEDEPNKCDGCNNVKGCIACVDGSEWAHIEEQKPTEWNEGDESNFQGIIDELNANKHHAPDYDLPTYDRFLSWFKSLKERYVWKPSDEQIEAFEHFVRSWGESGVSSPYDNYTKLIYSLLQDLKKLKE